MSWRGAEGRLGRNRRSFGELRATGHDVTGRAAGDERDVRGLTLSRTDWACLQGVPVVRAGMGSAF